MPIPLSPRLAALALSATLTACTVAREFDPPAPPPVPEVHDCRENMQAFRFFTIHATAVAWSRTAERRRDSVLTVNLEVANTDDQALALSNSGGGILYAVTAALIGRDGTRHAPSEMTGVLIKPVVHAAIKPAETKNAKLVFKVQRGPYTLSIERTAPAEPLGRDRGHLVAACTIAG